MDDKIQEALKAAPLSPEEKEHLRTILPTLSADKKEQLLFILQNKTQVHLALLKVQKVLDIIEDIQGGAETDSSPEEVQDHLEEAKEELSQTLEAPPVEVTPETLATIKDEQETKMQELRQELDTLKTHSTS